MAWTDELEKKVKQGIQKLKKRNDFSKDQEDNLFLQLKEKFSAEDAPEGDGLDAYMAERTMELKRENYDRSLADSQTEEASVPEGTLAEENMPSEEGPAEARQLDYNAAPEERDSWIIKKPEEGPNPGGDNEMGDRIRTIQEALVSNGYDVGPDGVDSYYGKDTEAAVKKYQEDNDMEPTGIVDKNLFGKITG